MQAWFSPTVTGEPCCRRGAQAVRRACERASRPMGGGRTPRPRRAMRCIKPATCTAMPAPPQGPHCTLLPGLPAPCTQVLRLSCMR